jgi:Zn-dependent alcohol dehydrogenase
MAGPKDIHTKAFVVPSLGSPFVLMDVILDEVRQNEVLVDMKYTGICHTVRVPDLIKISSLMAFLFARMW